MKILEAYVKIIPLGEEDKSVDNKWKNDEQAS